MSVGAYIAMYMVIIKFPIELIKNFNQSFAGN